MSECACSAQYYCCLFNDLGNRGSRPRNLVLKPTGPTSIPLRTTETSENRFLLDKVVLPESRSYGPRIPNGVLKIGDLSNLSHPFQNGQKVTS